MKKKNGFTLVELITTIVILSIILAIAIPRILNNISNEKDKIFKTSAINIVKDFNYKHLGEDFTSTTLLKLNLTTISSSDYDLNSSYIYVANDKTYIHLVGLGEFEGLICHGTVENMLCQEDIATISFVYNLNGGTTSQSFESSYAPNTKITLINPTKAGYTFTGWTVEGTGASLNGSELTTGIETTTITANWERNHVTLTVNLNEGSTTQSFEETYYSLSTLSLTNPTRTGYTFTGWTVEGTGASINGTKLTIGTSATIITANWRINKVYIRFHVNGGTIASSTTSTSGVTYNWSVSNSLVYRNGSVLQHIANYGAISSINLPDYNNINYMYITKTGYNAVSGSEWICHSGCTTKNKTFNQLTKYSASDFCDTSNGDCTVVLKVNWVEKVNPVLSYSCYNAKAGSSPYVLNYTGNCTVIDDGNGDWRVKFLTTGTLRMSKALDVDIFLVGGGGGGGKGFKRAYNVGIYSYVGWGGSGGGGGYTKTYSGINIAASTSYTITIGAGGTAQNNGSASSFKQGSTVIGTAAGGKAGGTQSAGGAGGSGGGGGGYLVKSTRYAGDGGSYGNSGTASGEECLASGAGQGSTTCEFGEGTLSGCTKGDKYAYAGGGGGGAGTVTYKSASNSEGYGTTTPKACLAGDSYGNTVNCYGEGGIRGGSWGGHSNTPSYSNFQTAIANTGGGGGGGGARDQASGSAGASGIVIIRNAR